MELNSTTTQTFWSDKKLHFGIIILLILLAYYKIFSAGFMPWDDTEYVLQNRDVHALSAENISKWFSSFYIGNYQPITIFSYALDYAFGGSEPFVYHLVNVLLHIGSALLLYSIIARLSGNKMVGLFTALLFALHPSQTESVSWVAERKNVLYGLFYLLSIWWYIRYSENKKWKWYGLMCAAALASMLSKGTAVALPLSLLAIDIIQGKSWRNLQTWLEKLPLFALSLVFGIIAIQAQAHDDFLNLNPQTSFFHTICFATYAYWSYIFQLFFPYHLSVLYPHPLGLEAIHVVALIALIGLAIGCYFLFKKKERMLLGGLLFYTVNIALVLQFIQFGKVLTADRYLYIPCIGIWLPAVYYLLHFFQKRGKEIVAFVTLSCVCFLFTALTFFRNYIWLSEFNFWNDVIETFPESTVAQYTMGGIYMKIGKYDEALEHINKALEIDPQNYRAYYNLALLYQRTGKPRQAMDALNQSIRIANFSKALFSRGIMLQQNNQPKEALQDFKNVIIQEPENAKAYFLKGKSHETLGNLNAAMDAYNTAISLNDEEPLFFLQRGLLLARGRKMQNAMADLDRTITLDPSIGQAWYWRGIMKSSAGSNPCADLHEALNHNFPEAQKALDKMCPSR